MEKLRLTCLGAVQMSFRGQDVALGNRKARALLVVLTVARGAPQRREALATMLWERSAQKQALNSVNQALYVLRRELTDAGFGGLNADIESIELAADAVEADFLEFEDVAKGQDVGALKAAIAQYRGPLMPDFTTSAPAFEQWLMTERARLANIATDAGTRLMALAEGDRGIDALNEAEALLSIDPYNEAAIRVQMRHLAVHERVGQALSAFDEFKDRLETELGVSPSEETRAFRDSIGRGEISSAKAVAGLGAVGAGATREFILGPVQYAMGGLAIILIAAVLAWFSDGGELPTSESEAPRLLLLPITMADGEDFAPAFNGLMDDLSVELTRSAKLELMSRETAIARSDWTAADARALGATHVLRGEIRLDQETATLILRLTETEDDIEVWSHRQTTDTDLLAFRERVLDDITNGLHVELAANNPDTADFTDDATAFEYYLTGLSAYHQSVPEQHRIAIEHFQSALAHDPEFALAQSALALAHFRTAFGSQEFADAMEVHWIEGFLAMKVAIADPMLERDPGALALRSQLALHRRDIEEATKTALAAVAIAPGDYRTRLTLARVFIFANDREAALEEAKLALALNPMRPENPFYLTALAHFGAGDVALAAEWINRVTELAGPVDPEFYAFAAATKALMQNKEAAAQFLDDFAAAIETRPRRLWRSVLAPSSNPRALTWDRPSLASVVARFPFQDATTVDRLARGLVAAGISGHTLGYYSATNNERLSEAQIRKLIFGARVEGTSPFGDGAVWRQDRTIDGEMYQSGALGPAPHSYEATSLVWNDQLCDRWTFKGNEVENCATLFEVNPDSVLPGNYLLINDLTYFPFSILDN